LTLVETLGIFVLHYVMNLSELAGNLNYLASNQFLKAFIPMPQLVGGLRPTEVILPANYDPSVPAPLLFTLPGYTDDKYYTENLLKFTDEASSRGYIYVIPNGIKNSVGERFWEATDACCDFLEMGWNDSQYLINMVDELSLKYSIKQDRIYFAGHSNGGFMAHRMACDHASRVAGIVSVAGMNFKDISHCKPSEPVNILQIHGTAD
jgi:polyhydroxybutyrate depolymerase